MSSDHWVHVGDEHGRRGFPRKRIHKLVVPDLTARWWLEKSKTPCWQILEEK